MRAVLKRVAERVLAGSGVTALVRRQRAGRTLVLAYHNIVPYGQPAAGDMSLHLPQAAFGRQLALLRRTHDVVPLEALLEEPRRRSRPRAVITFDDATQGALTAGVEELVRHRLPATFFVAPAFVGGRSFWWDALAVLSEDIRRHALEELAGRDEAIRAWAVSHDISLREVPAHQRCGTEAELAAAAGEAMSFGSHTWSHPNLAALPAAALPAELTPPLEWLRERFPRVVAWLAYPYGLASAEAEAAADVAGYDGALRIAGGWVPRHIGEDGARFRLPRQNVPAGLSPDGYRLRLAGLIDR